MDEGPELVAPALVGQAGWRLVEDESDDLHVWVLGQRRVTHSQLDGGDAEGPDVSRGIMAKLLHDLRCHPTGRPANCVSLYTLFHVGRHSEVSQQNFALQVEQDVAGLYVAVDFVV